MAFCTFSVLNQEKKQTFCLFHFFPNLLLVEKKNENALKHVLISSNCAKHIQGDDIKVVRGYLKYVVVVCLRSNIMFLCGILLGSYIRPIPHTPHIKLNCGSLPIWDVTSKQIYDSFFSKKHPPTAQQRYLTNTQTQSLIIQRFILFLSVLHLIPDWENLNTKFWTTLSLQMISISLRPFPISKLLFL